DVEASVLPESQTNVMTNSQQQQQQHRQTPQHHQQQQQQQIINNYHHQMLESQCSINSTTSIQTVVFQQQQQQQQQSSSSTTSSVILNNSSPKHNGSISMLQQQSFISTNSNSSINSQQNISYAIEALPGSLRHVSGSVNSLLEHIAPATMSSGRSQEGCPLIIFPDNNNFNTLEEVDYQKLILYLTSVPSLQDADLGFHLIIDRRKDKWTSVKTVLQRIS
ncbi:hypothetical protein DOY81_011087, partial [Sarcophaga bullata]